MYLIYKMNSKNILKFAILKENCYIDPKVAAQRNLGMPSCMECFGVGHSKKSCQFKSNKEKSAEDELVESFFI